MNKLIHAYKVIRHEIYTIRAIKCLQKIMYENKNEFIEEKRIINNLPESMQPAARARFNHKMEIYSKAFKQVGKQLQQQAKEKYKLI